MRISTNWIKDYVKLPTDLKDLALKVTKAGVNVEGVIQNKFNNLVIGHVVECTKHPDSDHLNICQVDVGSEVKQIVCGASNVRKGLKVIVSLPGAILPGDFEIKKSTIRGVESNGMICALYELGLEEKTEESHSRGICELDPDAPVGEDPIHYLGLDDTVYELDLNPNRNDCLSHIGFAYEVASVLGEEVTMPETKAHEIDESIKDHFSISVETDNCKMYQTRMVRNVKIKESPDFIKQRLINAGMRPINNVVDISNYIMLEYGQPLHFFDKDKLGDKIVVRMASDNEKTVTLDHKERTLSSDDIVITDGQEVVCIAGVMGCLNSDVDETTKDILIESAIFNPYNIRYTSIRLDLRSEASLRLEKELNFEYTSEALDRACYLLEKYAGGEVLKDKLVYDKLERKNKHVAVTLEQINDLLGMNLTDSDVDASLTKLGFKYQVKDGNYGVDIPLRRMDVETNKADIIEEIGRLYGYEKIESTLPIGPTKPGKYIGNVSIRKQISKRLRSLGLNECRTYTLVSEEESKMFTYGVGESISLNRPLASDKSIIRRTLIPSLLKVIDYNNARGVKDTFIYEIANTYSGEYVEDTKVTIALKGNYLMNKWQGKKIEADFYLLKGMIEEIFDYMGLKNRYSFTTGDIDGMHPGVSALILLDREVVGYFGQVHPSIRKDKVFVCEFSMNAIASKKIKPVKYKEISKYPSIVKDLAFVMKKDVTSGSIMEVIKKSGGRMLQSIDVFDLYVGENISDDEKSIAYTLTFQAPDRTLTDIEVNETFNKIINDVEAKTSAKLRK